MCQSAEVEIHKVQSCSNHKICEKRELDNAAIFSLHHDTMWQVVSNI